MTTLKVYSSPADKDRRSEFTEFYEAAYSTIVGELLALTGGLDHARAVGAGSFSRAWQAWPAIRQLPEPEMWVRQDATTRAYSPPRGMRLLQRGLPPIEPVDLHPEDAVLVTALQRLPMEQRLPLVLHYLAAVPAEVIAGWCHCAPAEVDALLDDGFDTLVALLDWPVDADEYVDGQEYDWTAEALQDSAQRLPQHITTPPPTISFRHATAVKLSKRGAPVGAAAAACAGLVVALSLAGQQPEARPAAFNPAPDTDGFVGPTLGLAPVDTSTIETTPTLPPTSATSTARPTLASRATPTTPLPIVQLVGPASVETSSSPATSTATPPPSTPATSTPATSTTATGTTATGTTATGTTATSTTATSTTATSSTAPPPSTAPSTVTVTVTAAPSTSSTTPTPTTTAEEEVETTTWTRPRPPVTTTTTSAESEPSDEGTITEVLPVTTSASEDD